MPLENPALDKVVDDFFDVLSGEASWTSVLDRFDAAVGATGTVLFRVNQAGRGGSTPPGPARGEFPRSTGVEGLVEAYVKQGWIAHDTRYQGVAALMRKGVITDADVTDCDDRKRSPFYQDFIAKNGFREFAGLRLNIGGHMCCASIQRGRSLDPFSSAELSTLVDYAPRISMAASLVFQLEKAQIAGAMNALDSIGTPVFILGRNGIVIAMNSAAPKLFGRGLDLVRGRLIAEVQEARKLDRYLADILGSSELSSTFSGRPIAIHRAEGRPLLARAQRLKPHKLLPYFSNGHCILTVCDPDETLVPSAALLRETFGLTTKEAEVLSCFYAVGGDWREVCRRASISYETYRSHMKRIHQKASASNKGELMALLAPLAAVIQA